MAPTTSTQATFWIPSMLRVYCGGAAELVIPGGTVGAALDELERRFDSLHRNIRDETGAVRRHVNIFVNSDNIRDRDGLGTRLEPGDTVTILPSVSGG